MGINLYKKNIEVPELLAPAGDFECLKAAIAGGADAVYLSGIRFGARAFAGNFDDAMLLEAIAYAHLREKKIYLTVNTLLKEWERMELPSFLMPLYSAGLDAVIMQDFGTLYDVHALFPDLPIHVSTQATVTSTKSALFYKKLGACRIVPARELSLKEIIELKKETQMEMECFVHGAMCYCYSGQCLLSSMIGGRSGNRGQCAQPCRLPYQYNRNEAKTIMSLKDLCVLDLIPDLIDASVDSFKIEGRMKQPDYVYTVTSIYRKYIESYLKYGREGYTVLESDRKALLGAYTRRGYSEGYYKKHNDASMISFSSMADIDKTFEDKPRGTKLMAAARISLKPGERAVLTISCERRGQMFEVSESGLEVQEAKDRPVTVERIIQQIKKTGASDFVITEVVTDMDCPVFIPISALNELRRRTLEKMKTKILEDSCREMPWKTGVELSNETDQGQRMQWENRTSMPYNPMIVVSVMTREQLGEVFRDKNTDIVIVDDELSSEPGISELVRRQKEKTSVKCYMALPYIFRVPDIPYYENLFQELSSFYDGVLIRNWDSYIWLESKQCTLPVMCDSNLYVFNKKSRELLDNLKIRDYTYPLELNKKELRSLGGGGIVTVYGYQTVMVTANCFAKTSGRCDNKSQTDCITDRKNKKFMVKQCCKCCYNRIYNSDYLFLLDEINELQTALPYGIRLDFTCERPEVVAAVLALVDNERIPCDRNENGKRRIPENLLGSNYTRGHYNRGVK